MSREVRRVPMDWKHPVRPNPYWRQQAASPYGRSRPASRLHAQDEQFVPLCDGYADRVADWEQEGRDLSARTGHHWTFSVEWHLTGCDDCSCHEGQTGGVHPFHVWDDAGEETTLVVVRDADHLHELLVAQHASERPDPSDYMPEWNDDVTLGWCLYETVSEGTPTTPVFATADELVDHLATVGQDYDQVPMRRAAAEALVSAGSSLGSMVLAGGRLYRSDVDADLLATTTRPTPEGDPR